MVAIRKKLIGSKEYYYLEHSFREGGSVKKRELYLGSEIPKNIEEIKKKFTEDLYKERWHSILEEIKKNYTKENKLIPESLSEKEIESFMIKFTYDTQKIEGSKLTLRETANLLEKGITPKEKPIRDVKEAETHKKVFYELLKFQKDLSLDIVFHWHRTLFFETKKDIAGILRKHQIAISGSKFMPPSPVEVYPLLNEFFKWYGKNNRKIHPVELAALVHLKFVTIHPFGDGNGRISRLMMNFVLKKHQYPMLNIKYERRNSYYNSLERSQVKKEEGIFIQWFVKNYIKENKRYLKK